VPCRTQALVKNAILASAQIIDFVHDVAPFLYLVGLVSQPDIATICDTPAAAILRQPLDILSQIHRIAIGISQLFHLTLNAVGKQAIVPSPVDSIASLSDLLSKVFTLSVHLFTLGVGITQFLSGTVQTHNSLLHGVQASTSSVDTIHNNPPNKC